MLIVENNLFFALALISQLKQLNLTHDLILDKTEAYEKIEQRLEDGQSYKLILISQCITCINDGIDLCKDIQRLSSDKIPESSESHYVCLMSSYTNVD